MSYCDPLATHQYLVLIEHMFLLSIKILVIVKWFLNYKLFNRSRFLVALELLSWGCSSQAASFLQFYSHMNMYGPLGAYVWHKIKGHTDKCNY